MNILIYTSLFPCARHPIHGIFVNELVNSLAKLAAVSVVAPKNVFREWLSRTRKPSCPSPKIHEAIRCRFWTIPKIFKSHDARLMAHFSQGAFQQALLAKPHLIHAHYAYPDGAAAAVLARRAGLPLIITCHGSDINVLAKDPVRARLMSQSLGQASAVVAVSRNLAGKIAGMGVDPRSIHHIPNGVDIARFPAVDKIQARMQLGIDPRGRLIAGVGRLEPVKGYDRLLRAVSLIPGVRLVLAGDGGQRAALERLACKLGLEDRVRFAGLVPHEKLAPYFQAADLLVISSHSEGWPTIIHEALACGTPVVAPAVGGIPEALADESLGLLVPSGEPDCLAQGIRRALDMTFDATILRQTAAAHDWSTIAARHLALYEEVLAQTH